MAKEISECQRQIDKNRSFLSGLYESFVNGLLTQDEYLEMKEDYSRKIACDVELVQRLQAEQNELAREIGDLTSLADMLAAVEEDTELTAALVNQVVERITVNGPEDVSIDFKFDGGFERVMGVLKDG